MNALSMTPFLVIAYIAKDPSVTIALTMVVFMSVVHHWNTSLTTPFVPPITTFIMDCFLQSMLVLAILGVTPHPRWFLAAYCMLIVVVMSISAYAYTWKHSAWIAVGIGCLYAVIILLNHHKLSSNTWLVMMPLVALFIAGNMVPDAYNVIWPLMHIAAAIVMYQLFKDLGIVYRP
jgi:hypothetical protein